MKYILSTIFAVALCASLLAQPLLKPETGTYLLKNATLVTVTNGTSQGDLLIADGKIEAMGQNVTAPQGAETIDCTGKFIYPGMIDGGTHLGLAEVNAVSLTRDYNELGDLNPHLQALTAVNPNSVAIPVTRVSGVTTVLATPSSGMIPGTASLINLVGYTPDQMFAGFKGVVLQFPTKGTPSRWRTAEQLEKRYKEQNKKLQEFWDEAELYAKIWNAAQSDNSVEVSYNPELEAMVPVINGAGYLLIEVDEKQAIVEALDWVKERGLKKVILTGVAEGSKVAEKIAAANIPVITGPILSIPTRSSDRYDRAYANAGIMQKAGVKVAIRTDDTENVRNLPYNAGFAAAYGMGKEEALKAVTIVPAEIFGVADQLGSLEVGKSGTLFISDGDPFETKTQVIGVFIDGWKIPMDSRHIRLYNEFLERQPGLNKN